MAEKRVALIIASNRYEDEKLQQLIAPAQDAKALARVLEDPSIGDFKVQMLLDEPSQKIRWETEAFFHDRERSDLLLLYFSCHGIKDDRGRLYYATVDTQCELLRATAIPSTFVNDIMYDSHSRRQVLILDCCYSGAFAKGMVAKADKSISTKERFEGRGRVVLTASDAMQYAFEGDKVVGGGVQSVFTRHLVRGLETGEADLDRDGLISLDELYDYVYERVTDETPQRPGKWAFDVQGEIIIGRNPSPVVTVGELPPGLWHAIESPFAGLRAGAVFELDRLLYSSDKSLAQAAYIALKRLTDDDSRRVLAEATSSLARYEKYQVERFSGPMLDMTVPEAEVLAQPRPRFGDVRVSRAIKVLANLMRARKENVESPYVLILGAGISLASGASSFGKVIESVVYNYSVKDSSVMSWDDTVTEFYDILDGFSGSERYAIIKKHIEGQRPSAGYHALASLVKKGYFNVIFSTNYDAFIEDAFADAGLRSRDFTVLINGQDTEEGIIKALSYPQPSIKLVKLHGDLGARIFAFTPEEILQFSEKIERVLTDYLSRDVIISGQSMRDDDINRCLREMGGSLWYVNPSAPTASDFIGRAMRVRKGTTIEGEEAYFDNFFPALYTILLEEPAPRHPTSVPTVVAPKVIEQPRSGSRAIKVLANLMRVRKENAESPYVLILGSGMSLASGASSFGKVIESVVYNYSVKDSSVMSWDDTVTEFYDILDGFSEGERYAIIKEHIEGQRPSAGYHALAQLAREGHFDVIFSTNYDAFIEDAFADAGLRSRDFTVLINGQDTEEGIIKALSYPQPRIKLVKLHGDLGARIFAFTPEEIFQFSEKVERVLTDYLSRDVIISGHSMRDDDINRCLRGEGGSLWYVNPSAPTASDFIGRAMRVRKGTTIEGEDGYFDNFFCALRDELVGAPPLAAEADMIVPT